MRLSRHLGLWGRSSGAAEADPALITVKIIGYGDTDMCHVTIDGTKYTDSATLQVPAGTSLQAYSSGLWGGSITVNGSSVSSGSPATHTMTITKAVTVELIADSTMSTEIIITY